MCAYRKKCMYTYTIPISTHVCVYTASLSNRDDKRFIEAYIIYNITCVFVARARNEREKL